MKKKLEISIKDNWFCDIYPTFIDFLAGKVSTLSYKIFGYEMSQKLGLYRKIKSLRGIEIFIFRRKQLKYRKNDK